MGVKVIFCGSWCDGVWGVVWVVVGRVVSGFGIIVKYVFF